MAKPEPAMHRSSSMRLCCLLVLSVAVGCAPPEDEGSIELEVDASALSSSFAVSPTTAPRGASVAVSGDGLRSGRTYTLTLARTKVLAFTATASRFAVQLTVPASIALGATMLRLYSPSGRVIASSDFTVGDAAPAPAPSPTPDMGTAPDMAPAPTPTPTPNSGIALPPSGKIVWDWQIGADGDSHIVAPAGARLMDVDGFGTSAAKVAQMKAAGIYTVCYINAGSYQPGYPDSSLYPSYLKIQADADWPGEYFLDVTDVFKPGSVLASILDARFQMCKDKGFDALEPDNLQNDENVSGGKITTQQQIDFNGWVADHAHAHGLAVFQKNGPDKILLKDKTGKMMVEKFDGILNEECQRYSECGPLAEYISRGKPALDVEYTGTLNCSMASSLGATFIKRDLDLVGPNDSGYLRVVCP